MLKPLVTNFTTNDAGMPVGTASAVSGKLLLPGHQLSINGSTDLRYIIVGDAGVLVNMILLRQDGAPTEYALVVQGEGPTGPNSGSLVITATSSAGVSHSLKMSSGVSRFYTLDFNATDGNIETISWMSDSP